MAKQTIEQRKTALLARIAQLEEEEKAELEAKYIVLGRLITEETEQDETFKTRINDLLSAKLKKNAERELFGLEKLASNRGRPKSDNEPENEETNS